MNYFRTIQRWPWITRPVYVSIGLAACVCLLFVCEKSRTNAMRSAGIGAGAYALASIPAVCLNFLVSECYDI